MYRLSLSSWCLRFRSQTKEANTLPAAARLSQIVYWAFTPTNKLVNIMVVLSAIKGS